MLQLRIPLILVFFAIIDPTEQITQYLQQHDKYYNWVMNERSHGENEMSEVYDGEKYREFRSLLEEAFKHRYVALALSTDGVLVFKSSKYSIWPVFLMINEIPIEFRFKSLITCGIWFGKTDPDMTIFLNPLVDRLHELADQGINVNILGKEITIKQFVLMGIFDTPARSDCNKTVRFNGKFGCDWCLHPTVHDGTATQYPKAYPIPVERGRQKMIQWCSEAEKLKQPVNGVRYITALYYLRLFDIIWGVVPDYMHCCLLGVGRQFLNLYFDRLDSI